MNKKKWHDLQTDRKFKHKLAREKHKAGQLREIISIISEKKLAGCSTLYSKQVDSKSMIIKCLSPISI